jgi:S1-C subfamily serine protease
MKLEKNTKGALIVSIEKDGPAIKPDCAAETSPWRSMANDHGGRRYITAMDGKSIESVLDLRNRILRASPGDEVKLTILRDGKEQEITVKLEERPAQ